MVRDVLTTLRHFACLLRFEDCYAAEDRAAAWLVAQCSSIPGVETTTLRNPCEEGEKPIVLAKVEGSDPSLPRIVLNSHYDVVPAMRDMWCCDPFGAEIRDGYGDGP